MKEIEEGTNKLKDISHLWIDKINIANLILINITQSCQWIQCAIPVKILTAFFHRNRKKLF